MPELSMPLRAVAFDLDGTLADSTGGICSTFSTVLSAAGHPVPHATEITSLIGLPLADVMLRFAPAGDINALVTHYRAIYTASIVPSTLLFPRAWSLLRACRAAGLEL